MWEGRKRNGGTYMPSQPAVATRVRSMGLCATATAASSCSMYVVSRCSSSPAAPSLGKEPGLGRVRARAG